MDKKPRFFCDNCNAEVKRDAKFCNKCGHFFSSVKCPACGKVGSASLFKNGCPLCGYAVGSSSLDTEKKSSEKKVTVIGKRKRQTSPREEGLPVWIYVITITALLLVVVFLFFYI